MQYNNIVYSKVPQSTRKSPMTSSHFFPQGKSNYSDIQSLNKKQSFFRQRNDIREGISVPTFLQTKKSQNVSQSMIFNTSYPVSQVTFNNPFTAGKYARGSVQQSKRIKDGVPSFLKNDEKASKQDSKGKAGFYKKFKSPQPLKAKQSLFSSGPISRDSALGRSRKESQNEFSQQGFSPVNPRRLTQTPSQVSTLDYLNRKLSQNQKQKNDLKQDQRTTMSLSQKSSKLPEFLKSGNNKQVSQQQLMKSQRICNLQKVSSEPCTQPQSPIYRKKSDCEGRFGGFTNYVETQTLFSKKKPSDFTSASFAKFSNTPQSNPVKLQHANFQFGRLSSPIVLNHRKILDLNHSPKKQFRINNFQLVDKIGKGAFGDVYIARQKTIGFLCVLKKMSKKKIKQSKLEENVMREIKIQAFLKHKHLTSLYGFFADQDYIYLILEILPDGSMNHVKKKKKVPQTQTSKYVRQVCQGLRYMHKEQIIHRDLKPQNIFINQGYLKIGDFGCAVYTQTLRKTIVGCLAYISPQQLNNQFYDDKIDVWSIGILTYELITGKAPFQEDIVKISRQQIQPKLSKLSFPQDLQISDTCKDFICKLLQLDPQDRMTIDQTMRHPFITKIFQQERKQQQQIFGIYQSM